MFLLSEGIKISEKTDIDKRGVGNALGAVGNIYSKKGKYHDALEYYEKSLAIMNNMGDKYGIATGLASIGSIYLKKGDYDSALEFYKQRLEIGEEIGGKQIVAIALGNLFGGILSGQLYAAFARDMQRPDLMWLVFALIALGTAVLVFLYDRFILRKS